MIEPYQWLLAWQEELGYKKENISGASVDLELGEVKVFYRRNSQLPLEPLILLDNPIVFYPNTFYLCSTVEYIKVPSTHCAFINMRSSLARKGLGHKMAGFIDPGFEGQITLELEAAIPVEVLRGERIVQIIYMRLSEKTQKPYEGKYKGQVGATEAYQLELFKE